MFRSSAARSFRAIVQAVAGAVPRLGRDGSGELSQGFSRDFPGQTGSGRRSSMFERLESRQLLSVNVTTYHYDNARDGANTNETALTLNDVNDGTFGKIGSLPVDGQVYAQPLVMTGVPVFGQGTHDIVLVATENDTVYAFDAAGNNPAQGYLWKTSLLQAGETAVPQTDYATNDITPLIGITGTPVIDPTTNLIYVVGAMKEANATYVQRLYALNITSGAVALGGPVTIAGSVPGDGYGNVNGVETFSPYWENQRPALTLANGQVYIAWSAHGDENPWHGWVISYSASTLAQEYVYCDTANGDAGGIWMSGGGLAVDSVGNLYFTTGNGDFDPADGNYGMAIVKLSPSLAVEDYFAPWNQSSLSNYDLDYGCSSVIILPTQTGANPDEVLTESKWGTMFLNNNNASQGGLGGYTYSGAGTGTNDDLSEVSVGGNMHNTISYWNGLAFVGGDGLPLKEYTVGGGSLGQTPSSESAHVYGTANQDDGQGAGVSISSNGSSNGIAWALDNSGFNNNPAVLYAYNASNLSQVLWTSAQAPNGRDTAADAVKFQTPVVANGYVYVAGAGSVSVYGLINASTSSPTLTTPAAATPSTVTGTTTTLSVVATDITADLHPVYNWAATTVPNGAITPTFSTNGTNASNDPTATFYAAGTYTFTATITDPNSGLAITSSVNVTVNQTLTGISILPASTTIYEGGTQQFAAAAVDQFGNAMAGQPSFTWTSTGTAGGTVSATGLYQAPPNAIGTDTVTAASGTMIGTATVSVVPASATIPVNLSAYDNTIGIVTDDVAFNGGLDNGGSSWSGNLLGTSQTWNASTFSIPAATPNNTTDNVVSGTGQTITLSQNKYSAIKFLGAHLNGNATGLVFTVNYTDGTSQTFTQSMSDWYTPQGYAGEGTAVAMAYRDIDNGTLDDRTFYMYGYSFGVNGAKTVQSITLPNDAMMNVVAMDVVGLASTAAPALATPAAATPATASGTTTTLTALATDISGDSAPTYTWAAADVPAGATTPTFSANSNASANSSTATFHQAGNYTFTVTITDPSSGVSITSSVNVTVVPTSTRISVTPATATVPDGAAQQFTGTALDQFGQALASQPTFTWSIVGSGIGSISTTGLYQAPASGAGSATVQAASGAITAQAVVAVANAGTATFYPTQAGWYRAGVWQGTSGADGGGGYTSPAGSTVLISKNPSIGTLRDSYLLYNISNAAFAGDTVTGVTLTFEAAALNQAGPVAFGVYGVANTSWGSTTADPAPAPNYTGATEIGTTQNVGGAQGNYSAYTFSLAGEITNTTNGLITLELNSPGATSQETGIEIDNALNSPGVDPVITVSYTVSQPAWLAAGSFATWNAGTKTLTVTGPTSIIADPGTDDPVIQASGAAAVVTINTASGTDVHIAALNLSNGATVNVPPIAAAGVAVSPRVLILGQTGSAVAPLTIGSTSTLNLSDNDLDVIGGTLSAVSALVGRGDANGTWSGTSGITSSTAAGDTTHLTALGVIQNNQSGKAIFSSTNLFGGEAPGASDILVSYTYVGDANLDGQVDGSDYSLIDAGYLADNAKTAAASGWFNGDFNYDGTVDGSDYALIDNAFNNQGPNLNTQVDFPGGFASAGSSILYNGNASLNGTQIQLTPNTAQQVGSAYYVTPLNVNQFNTRFTFVTTAGNTADGFTFVIQNQGPTALGQGGGALGYQGITNSVAVKFDLYNNNGEGPDSTGLYQNGAIPQNVGSIDLSNTGINFHSGDIFQADMTYNGATLIVVITDTATGATATQTYAVNIASVIGSNTAYFGFTGGTGGITAQQAINSWTVASAP